MPKNIACSYSGCGGPVVEGHCLHCGKAERNASVVAAPGSLFLDPGAPKLPPASEGIDRMISDFLYNRHLLTGIAKDSFAHQSMVERAEGHLRDAGCDPGAIFLHWGASGLDPVAYVEERRRIEWAAVRVGTGAPTRPKGGRATDVWL